MVARARYELKACFRSPDWLQQLGRQIQLNDRPTLLPLAILSRSRRSKVSLIYRLVQMIKQSVSKALAVLTCVMRLTAVHSGQWHRQEQSQHWGLSVYECLQFAPNLTGHFFKFYFPANDNHDKLCSSASNSAFTTINMQPADSIRPTHTW